MLKRGELNKLEGPLNSLLTSIGGGSQKIGNLLIGIMRDKRELKDY